MIDALANCFDWSPGDDEPTLRDPVTCPDCDGEGGEEVDAYSVGISPFTKLVACERCRGRQQVDWSDLSEDEQIEYLQAEVDMLRERLEPVPLFDDLEFDEVGA